VVTVGHALPPSTTEAGCRCARLAANLVCGPCDVAAEGTLS
jgi:hypothetical protein